MTGTTGYKMYTFRSTFQGPLVLHVPNLYLPVSFATPAPAVSDAKNADIDKLSRHFYASALYEFSTYLFFVCSLPKNPRWFVCHGAFLSVVVAIPSAAPLELP
ncbi:hypothetical protein DFH07DRAFT_273895 [Mycena maculata]|uniref:Uncharacterized protein n=1 Tax=Mycena maculata TaxID=230809 RepID=A0AAD7MNJ1_9AGAR|nr:hypothetical protein DFH07DRAFT_273895 [Mycena maculata]